MEELAVLPKGRAAVVEKSKVSQDVESCGGAFVESCGAFEGAVAGRPSRRPTSEVENRY